MSLCVAFFSLSSTLDNKIFIKLTKDISFMSSNVIFNLLAKATTVYSSAGSSEDEEILVLM